MKTNIVRTLGLSAIFLFIFLIVIQLYTNILWIFNVSIMKYNIVIEFVISILIFLLINYLFNKNVEKEKQKRKELKKEEEIKGKTNNNIKEYLIQSIASILIGAIVFTVAVYLVGKIYDTTADGNSYHKLAVGSMKNGWNPMYESSKDFTKEDGNALTVLDDNVNYMWADHYAMGTEIIGANIYAFTDNIESGKAFTLVMMFIGFGITLDYLILKRKWIDKKFGIIKGVLVSALLVINPITLVQMGTYYVDSTLAISLFIIILELININSKDIKENNEKNKEKNKIESYLILAISIMMCSNAKFTGLGYAAVFCAAFYIYMIIDKIRMYKKGILEKKELSKNIIGNTVYYIIVVIITICIIGSTSYLKNIITKGHPFYPLYGEGHVENMVNKEIPESLASKPNIVQFFISIFSKCENVSPSYSDVLNEPDLKVPFTMTKEEINNFNIPDIRIGGFGPLYSGIFIITAIISILKIIDYIKNRKYKNLTIYLIIIGVSTLLLTLLDGSYWARYIPYVYMITIINLAYLFEKDKKVYNIIGIILTILLAINSGLVLKTSLTNYIGNSRYVKRNLIEFEEYAKEKEEVPIALNLSAYQGVQYNLDDLGINVKIVNQEELEKSREPKDGLLFKY